MKSLVEDFIPLFSSVASVQNASATGRAKLPAAVVVQFEIKLHHYPCRMSIAIQAAMELD
jgi:hypothetical protein